MATDFSEVNPYRRNLILISAIFLIYYFGDGEFKSDLSFGIVPITLDNPTPVIIFAYALLIWMGVRYYQNTIQKTFTDYYGAHINNGFNGTMVCKHVAQMCYEEKTRDKGGIPFKGSHVQGQRVSNSALKNYLYRYGCHAVTLSSFNAEVKPLPIGKFKIQEIRSNEGETGLHYLVPLTDINHQLTWLQYTAYKFCMAPKILIRSSDYLSHAAALVMYGVTLGIYLIIIPIEKFA